MNGYNFTERVRKVLAMAREEAHALRHDFVDTEHILLGLIRDAGGVGYAVLENLTRDVDAIRDRLLERSAPRGAVEPAVADLPYTSVAKKALELAMAEARELMHSYVGTEHLLLGLVREKRGLASKVLGEFRVTADAARVRTIEILGTESAQLRRDDAVGNDASATPLDTPRCAECDVEMERGHLAVRPSAPVGVASWVRGTPPRRAWIGGAATAVVAFRCPTCGALRLVAPLA